MKISNIKTITKPIAILIIFICKDLFLYKNIVIKLINMDKAHIIINGKLKIGENTLPKVSLMASNENNFKV